MTNQKTESCGPRDPAAVVPPAEWVRFLGGVGLGVVAELATKYNVPFPSTPDVPPPPIPPIPPIPPVPPPGPIADALAAIVRISAPGVGCSGTIIGPRRPDGRWWILTAAHCMNGIGQRWTMRFRDGRTGGFTIVAFHQKSDYAWGVTDSNDASYPFALLAAKSPAIGDKVWHAGYGVDNPSNREDGTYTGGPDGNGQSRYTLSVSSGDSGGGIVANAQGEILSPVCCTSRLSGMGSVWGASPEASRAGQRDNVNLDEWIPSPVPLHESAKGDGIAG